MYGLLIVGAVAVLVAVAIGARVMSRLRDEDVPAPPPRAWKGDTITPQAMGPRSKAPERVVRERVVSQAVLLAAEMARADGEVAEVERQAIRAFILEHVTGADPGFAERTMRDGFARTKGTDAVGNAVETLRAIASEEQRKLTLQLLVAVARADESIHDREVAFMERVGTRMGLDVAEVRRLIAP